jgi:DNA ligase (NAD+)
MKASEYLLRLKQLNISQLLTVDGFAEKTAKNIVDYADSKEFNDLIVSLVNLEQNKKGIEVKINTKQTSIFKGSICVTGRFDLPRDEMYSKIEDLGFKPVNTITSNLNYLLVGDKGGSKIEKATKLGVKIIYDLSEVADI